MLPPSGSEIEEFAFKECIGLEECPVTWEAILTKIEQEAFAGWISLRLSYVPKSVQRIGENCFRECPSLSRLRFGSEDTLKRIMGDTTLDEALKYLGFTEISSLIGMEVEEDVFDLSFPGRILVAGESLHSLK
jgi:hypothetical protein